MTYPGQLICDPYKNLIMSDGVSSYLNLKSLSLLSFKAPTGFDKSLKVFGLVKSRVYDL